MVMCHAADDEFIPIEQARWIFDAYSNSDKKLVVGGGGTTDGEISNGSERQRGSR
jgi:esterase/lipase